MTVLVSRQKGDRPPVKKYYNVYYPISKNIESLGFDVKIYDLKLALRRIAAEMSSAIIFRLLFSMKKLGPAWR